MNRLIERAKTTVQSTRGRVIPYAIAWFLGVPLFVLVLIRLIRGH